MKDVVLQVNVLFSIHPKNLSLKTILCLILKVFFEELNSIFQTTRELLQDKIDEFFPEEIIKEEEERQKSIEEKINNSGIVKESKKYSLLVSIWIEKNKEFINQYRTLESKETENNQYDSMNSLIPEAIEVILFYQYFIEIKIRRALFDKIDEEANDSINDEDMLTSAKLILLSITRSIAS